MVKHSNEHRIILMGYIIALIVNIIVISGYLWYSRSDIRIHSTPVNPTPTIQSTPIPVIVTPHDIPITSRGNIERSPSDKYNDLLFEKGMSKNTFNALYDVGIDEGLPVEVWYPIVMLESEGIVDKTTISKYEHSIGCFQINTLVHKADGISIQEFRQKLKNPTYNAKWQMPVLAKVYNKAKNYGFNDLDIIYYVERYGERPNWSNIDVRRHIYNAVPKHYNMLMKARE